MLKIEKNTANSVYLCSSRIKKKFENRFYVIWQSAFTICLRGHFFQQLNNDISQCLFPGWINKVLQSDVIVKSNHGLRTCSSRRFQWYPTTYMFWALLIPYCGLGLAYSKVKVLSWLNTYRLWGIIGIVLMSTFLILNPLNPCLLFTITSVYKISFIQPGNKHCEYSFP